MTIEELRAIQKRWKDFIDEERQELNARDVRTIKD